MRKARDKTEFPDHHYITDTASPGCEECLRNIKEWLELMSLYEDELTFLTPLILVPLVITTTAPCLSYPVLSAEALTYRSENDSKSSNEELSYLKMHSYMVLSLNAGTRETQ